MVWHNECTLEWHTKYESLCRMASLKCQLCTKINVAALCLNGLNIILYML